LFSDTFCSDSSTNASILFVALTNDFYVATVTECMLDFVGSSALGSCASLKYQNLFSFSTSTVNFPHTSSRPLALIVPVQYLFLRVPLFYRLTLDSRLLPRFEHQRRRVPPYLKLLARLVEPLHRTLLCHHVSWCYFTDKMSAPALNHRSRLCAAH
jgi:hypothetical protein